MGAFPQGFGFEGKDRTKDGELREVWVSGRTIAVRGQSIILRFPRYHRAQGGRGGNPAIGLLRYR